MIIHTVDDGETPFSIARKYGIPVTKLLSDNSISTDRLIPGEQLAVIFPTRTVSVNAADTLEKLAKRFSVRPSYILSANPALGGKRRLTPGQTITVKQAAPTLGCASAVGYIHNGISPENLTRSLPYITYYLINSALLAGAQISYTFDSSDICAALKEEGKIPILCVQDLSGGEYLGDRSASDKLIRELICAAREGGFFGVCISSPNASDERFAEFVMLARRGFIGSDLLFFTEVKEDGAAAAELSDGAILHGVFKKGKEALSRFASSTESSKIFISLDCEPKRDGRPISVSDARKLCLRDGKRFAKQKEDAFIGFTHTAYTRGKAEHQSILCPSLEYIKAKLTEISELGYMGIAVNIGNLPTAIYSIFNALFARADYSGFHPM